MANTSFDSAKFDRKLFDKPICYVASYTAQTERIVTTPASATFIWQTLRILSNLAGYNGKALREVTNPAGYEGQTHREVVASTTYSGQTKRFFTNLAGFIGQAYRVVLNTLIFTDKTTAANNATAGDINLLPSSPVVGDCLYIGSDYKFNRIYINQSTAGAGNWATEEKYWNGSYWTTCTILADYISSFVGSTGNIYIEITPEEDWVTTTVNGVTAYWVQFELVSFVAMTTQPKATQIWVEKLI